MGSGYLLVCPAFPVRSGRACSAVGQVVAAVGGLNPIVLRHRASQDSDQGQWVGRCRVGLRWGRARRAGMLTILRRRVRTPDMAQELMQGHWWDLTL